MAVLGGKIDCQIPVKIVKIDRWRKTVTLEVLDDPWTESTYHAGDTLMINYALHVKP